MSLELDRSKWQRVNFGDVVKNVNESVKDPAVSGIERVIGLEHLEPGELRIDRWGEVTPETKFTRSVKPGQTLFGKRRSYQRKTAYAEFDAVCSGDILVFESANPTRLLPELLPFIAMSDGFYNKALETSAGSLSPRTRWSDLAKYEFDLPPLDQQKRIADLLWTVEKHRRATIALLLATENSRQTFRSEWMEKYSGNVQELQGVASIPPQNGLSRPKATRTGRYPMIDMGALFRGEVVACEGFEGVNLGPGEDSKFALASGDLLFARQSIVFKGAGVCCLVPEMSGLAVFESHVIRVRVDDREVKGEFLLHYFRSGPGRRKMSGIVRRGPVSGVAGSDLKRLEVPTPPADQVNEFLGKMMGLDQAAEALRVERDRLDALLESVANQVFV
ncbi:restriction endonuclease subunit S [Actinomycetota bacterium]|nr:restriction endonuclease subunit S [Actinomycetota bacterium]